MIGFCSGETVFTTRTGNIFKFLFLGARLQEIQLCRHLVVTYGTCMLAQCLGFIFLSGTFDLFNIHLESKNVPSRRLPL